jgi:protocatechuate 3,4-dioxygenase beta subunit
MLSPMHPRVKAAGIAGSVVLAAGVAACGGSSSGAANAATAPARVAATCARTVALTEGPYWKAGSPAHANLRAAGVKGTPLRLTGRVVTTSCAPIAGAVLDVWQADGLGRYDNAGFRLRGHFSTRSDGTWTLNTVIPGQYPGRTEHVHVKVRTPAGSTLTTQLFFPGVASNDSDGIYVPSMLVRHFRKQGARYRASFTFALAH